MTEHDTETATPDPRGHDAPPVPGVVVVFTEGVGPMRRAFAPVGEATVGRRDDVDVVLHDPKASRRHAVLEPAAAGVFVADAGSRNGVLIDGTKAEGRAYAPAGSVLRIGNSLLIVVGDVVAFERARERDGELVGGPALDEVRAVADSSASTEAPVLVLGESGVGKELVARLVHRCSGRDGPLVAINCAAIPSELMESELFGHGRGAFSGAEQARAGLMRSAAGGTLFLDEIGEMPMGVQAKLLRAVETGEVRPVGQDQPQAFDARIVAATNVELHERIRDGGFRADLYHRIATHVARVPPLRQRREDIPLLVAHFAPEVEVSADAMQQLMAYDWPGNVRELQNAVIDAVRRADAKDGSGRAERIQMLDLPESIREAKPAAKDTERSRYIAALETVGGNVSEAARQLEMRRATLHEHLRRLGIDPAEYRNRR